MITKQIKKKTDCRLIKEKKKSPKENGVLLHARPVAAGGAQSPKRIIDCTILGIYIYTPTRLLNRRRWIDQKEDARIKKTINLVRITTLGIHIPLHDYNNYVTHYNRSTSIAFKAVAARGNNVYNSRSIIRLSCQYVIKYDSFISNSPY